MVLFLKQQGVFFYSVDEILADEWITKHNLVDITERDDGTKRTDWAEAFVRTQTPNYEVPEGRSEKPLKEFQVTQECMTSHDPVASLNS